jgi:membrane protease YdiL (CAAX protease family)
MAGMPMRKAINPGAWWAILLAGFVALFALLQGSATALASVRGEAGLIVLAATLAAALLVQRGFFAGSWADAWRTLGLGAPRMRGLATAGVVSLLALCAYPVFLLVAGGGVSLHGGAALLAVGVFAQGGVAEELVFRGYLYGHLRRRFSFWRAASISVLPFAAAHLYTFAVMAWPVALAALALSVVLSFPLAHLYELGGRTIWAPAIAHAVVQGAIKLIVIDDLRFPIVWMGASALALWLVFLVGLPARDRS